MNGFILTVTVHDDIYMLKTAHFKLLYVIYYGGKWICWCSRSIDTVAGHQSEGLWEETGLSDCLVPVEERSWHCNQ